MEIRRLNAGDMLPFRKIQTIAYNQRNDFSKEEKPDDPLSLPAEWSWGAFDKGRLVSAMTEYEFLMRFDRNDVGLSGIGGVATLPEARKGGCVKAIFEKLLPEAYDKGVVFSNLNPFSHAFYRKFGYEVCCFWRQITIPTREFSHLKLRGTFTQIFPGDDCSALNEVLKTYISDINHGIHRDHWPNMLGWKRVTRHDPYNKGRFFYLWQDENGRPGAYIDYQHFIENNEHAMRVNELAFTSRDALYGVLSLVSGLEAQIRKLRWFMPGFLEPTDFISEPRELEQKLLLHDDMSRIINVKVALEKMRKPEGEGSFIVAVNDEWIKANTGTYLIEYGLQGCKVTLTQKEPDIRCDIPALSQLVLGYRTLENSLRTRQTGIEVYGNREILDKVFTLRPQHLTEYF
ncbi:MAG: GNAT family N-acetyltransferase [Treponema sp.]|nr:GNAT family N-acetyltransferase [Treponema sp.]